VITGLNKTSSEWVELWDRQQDYYVPRREERFDVLFDAVEGLVGLGTLPPDPHVLDLGCGPAAIGARLSRRLPAATYVGVDLDPVLLHLGRSVADGGRLRLERRDLTVPGWSDGLGSRPWDVVVSSTALHWLSTAQLTAVVGEARRAMAPHGVLLNADNLSFAPEVAALQQLSVHLEGIHGRAEAAAGAMSWHEWWDAVRADPVLGPLCVERDEVFPPATQTDDPPPPLEDYRRALRDAGFRQVDTIWQRWDDRVLMALVDGPG
jgi:SAM-dependent methyltransferase